jgi:ribonuclease P protein subunit RPR2
LVNIMSKGKGQKGAANKHLQSRINYLHQAATYLASQGLETSTKNGTNLPTNLNNERLGPVEDDVCDDCTDNASPVRGSGNRTMLSSSLTTKYNAPETGGLALRLSSQLRQVAAKSQARLPVAVKHSACKRCNTVLLEGQTCTKFIENLSKDGRKAHANVLVLRCNACTAQQRFPIGATRQTRKSQRKSTGFQNDAYAGAAAND